MYSECRGYSAQSHSRDGLNIQDKTKANTKQHPDMCCLADVCNHNSIGQAGDFVQADDFPLLSVRAYLGLLLHLFGRQSITLCRRAKGR